MAPRQPSPERRCAILDAALSLFTDRGFHGTNVPSVASEAGVGAGTIYRYFESKSDLVNELYQNWKRELGEALMTDFPVDKPPREQFAEFWCRASGFAQTNPTALQFLETHNHADYLNEESREVERQLLQGIYGLLEQLRDQQVVKDMDPSVLMAVSWGVFSGVHKAHWAGHVKLTPQILEQAEMCAWEAIRR
jgi:AcrR family transcriptional regulator